MTWLWLFDLSRIKKGINSGHSSTRFKLTQIPVVYHTRRTNVKLRGCTCEIHQHPQQVTTCCAEVDRQRGLKDIRVLEVGSRHFFLSNTACDCWFHASSKHTLRANMPFLLSMWVRRRPGERCWGQIPQHWGQLGRCLGAAEQGGVVREGSREERMEKERNGRKFQDSM